MRVLVARWRISLLLVRGRGRRLLLHTSFRTRARIGHLVSQDRGRLLLPTAWACETGLPLETGIPGHWDSAVLVSCRAGECIVYSSTPYYGLEEPVSVSGFYTSTFDSTGGPEGPKGGSRSGTGLTGRDF